MINFFHSRIFERLHLAVPFKVAIMKPFNDNGLDKSKTYNSSKRISSRTNCIIRGRIGCPRYSIFSIVICFSGWTWMNAEKQMQETGHQLKTGGVRGWKILLSSRLKYYKIFPTESGVWLTEKKKTFNVPEILDYWPAFRRVFILKPRHYFIFLLKSFFHPTSAFCQSTPFLFSTTNMTNIIESDVRKVEKSFISLKTV